MDVAFACPADGSVLLVSRGGYDCPTCGQHFPVERGVVRRRVATAGRDRCLASDYSHRGQLQRVLDVVEEIALTRRRSRGAASSS